MGILRNYTPGDVNMLAMIKATLWPPKFEKCFDNLSLEASPLEVSVCISTVELGVLWLKANEKLSLI